MSGSKNRKPLSVQEENEAHFTYFLGAAIALGGIILLWLYDRKVFVIPFSYYALPQFYLARMLSGGSVATTWITALLQAVHDPKYADQLPVHFFSGACSFLAYHLWWLYLMGAFALGVMFNRHSNTHDEFTGAFHLTGYEYHPVWFFRSARLPEWANRWCNSRDAMRGRGPVQTLFRRLSRKGPGDRPGPLHTEVVRVQVGRSLIEYQSQYWRNMKPIAVWDPHDTIKLLWPDRRPEKWAENNQIITEDAAKEIMARTVGGKTLSPLAYDYHRAQKVLELQVKGGGRWRGILKAPAYIQALATICYQNRFGKQKIGIEIAYACAEASVPLWRLRENATTEQIKATQRKVNSAITVILKGESRDPRLPHGRLFTPEIAAKIDEMALGHYWLRTAVISILGQCGPHKGWGGGDAPVLQPALLQFLQPMDRSLFFAIASVGAEKYLVEGMGIIAQYQNERAFWTHAAAKIHDIEREIRIKRERAAYDQARTGGPQSLTMPDDLKAEIESLQRALADWQNYRKNEPALDMNGPLSYLEELIVRDRNVGPDR